MIDFKIIFNYLSIPFFLLIFLYLFYLNKKSLNSLPKFHRNLLLFLRGTVIFFLFIILVNPILKTSNEYTYNKKLVFFIDNSKSMLSSIDDNFIDYLNKNVKKSNNKNINTFFYTFGDTITNINYLSDISFNAMSTNFNHISQKISSIDSDYNIIVSDGMHNEGILEYSDFYDYSINTFQVESVDSTIDDISIKSVNVNKIDDNYTKIKCDFEVLAKKNYDDIKIFLSNDLTKNQEVSSINLKKGNNSLLHDILIENEKLSKNNTLFITELDSEMNLINNQKNFNFDINDFKNIKTLLISGRLSNNTKYIKKILKENDLEFIHYFRKNDLESIKGSYDLIIFDSFPSKKSHLNIINKNEINSSKFLYFQGPVNESDLVYANDFLKKSLINLEIKPDIDKNIYFKSNSKNNLVNGLIAQIAPFNSNYKATKTNLDNCIVDINSNDLIISNEVDSLFIFIPDLLSISNETKVFYKNKNFDNLIEYLVKKTIKNNNLINIFSDRNIYNSNEFININLSLDGNFFEDDEIKLLIENSQGELISKFDEFEKNNENNYTFSIKFQNEQMLFAQVQIEIDDDTYIKSNKISFLVKGSSKELSNFGLDQKTLEKISFSGNSKSYSINELDKFISNLDNSFQKKIKTTVFHFFNFQLFWFIIIVFLILEWIIRKKRGLL